MSTFGSLSGKLAVVSGGGGGIGRAICQRFAQLGASVMVVDLKKPQAEETCSTLQSGATLLSFPSTADMFMSIPVKVDYVNASHSLIHFHDVLGSGQTHFPVHCDISGSEFVDQLVEVSLNHFKKVPEILVNNAGVTMDSQLHKMSEMHWDWVMDINLKGTFLMTKAFAGEMVKEGNGGSIINISSIVGKIGNFGQANYAASKAGVIGLTKTCAKELGPKGIRVNAILPGFIETPMTEKVPEKVIAEMRKNIPLQRLGRPEEIADSCAFLASDSSSYINGALLEVTGGLGM